jgi:hypothetical protein
MFSFYSSISRLLGSNTQTLKSTESYVSLYPNTMLSSDFSTNKIISKNDSGETVILEYLKHDKTFDEYTPKFFKYKYKNI